MPTVTPEAGEHYKTLGATWIETYTGIKFSLYKPEFNAEDIAHCLANLCRFNGHTRTFYSVAEHSLLVSALVYHMGGNQQQCLEALLHDATEAYMSDVPAPFKQLLPDWQKLDKDLDDKLREWADLPATKTGLVKDADWLALFIEAYWLLPDKGESFPGPEGMRGRAMALLHDYNLFFMPPNDAERAFLGAWAELLDDA